MDEGDNEMDQLNEDDGIKTQEAAGTEEKKDL